jgi:hypothetical protein
MPKCGKTHWYLTGPPPIRVIDIDGGMHRVIGQFLDKDIEFSKYRREYSDLVNSGDTEKAIAEAANRELQMMREDYMDALHSRARLTAVDGWAELYEMVRLAAFGRLERAGATKEGSPFGYGAVNREMQFWIDLGKESDCNVVFVQRLRQKWMNDKPTDIWEAKGWKETNYAADVVVQHWHDPSEPVETRYGLTIMNCGLRAVLEGVEIPSERYPIPSPTFADVGRLLFPNSQMEDWQ